MLSGAREPGQERERAGMGGNADVVRGLGGRGGDLVAEGRCVASADRVSTTPLRTYVRVCMCRAFVYACVCEFVC